MTRSLFRGLVALLAAAGPLRAQVPVPPLAGHVSTGWGAFDHNRCVPSVAGGIAALGSPSGDLLGFRMDGMRGLNRLFAHWQGIQRVPGGDGRWLVLSRSRADVGFVTVQLGSRSPGGARFGSNRLSPDKAPEETPPPAGDAAVRELPAPGGFTHGGGMQMIGQVLVVPFEGGRGHSVVAFYDLVDPARPRLLHLLRHEGLPPPSDPGHASAAGIVKLADGRFLLLVGEHSSKVLDFYVSRGTSLDPASLAFDWITTLQGVVTGGFQNMNLVTQCDGALYLVGTHNTSLPPPALGSDMIRWYRLANGSDGGIEIQPEGTRHLVCRKCNFAAGAGLYIDPAGQLLLYAVAHNDAGPESSVEFEEFRPTFRGPAEVISQAWAEFYEGRRFKDPALRLEAGPDGEETGTVALPDRLQGRVTSLRWSVPDGWRLRLYYQGTCGGGFVDLTGTGESDDLTVLGFDDRLSCARWIPEAQVGLAGYDPPLPRAWQ
jgi:hypothetical protein